jgi:hypothetical protein
LAEILILSHLQRENAGHRYTYFYIYVYIFDEWYPNCCFSESWTSVRDSHKGTSNPTEIPIVSSHFITVTSLEGIFQQIWKLLLPSFTAQKYQRRYSVHCVPFLQPRFYTHRSTKCHNGEVRDLLCIQEVLGSALSQDTGYPDRVFMVFLSLSRQMLGYCLKLCNPNCWNPFLCNNGTSDHIRVKTIWGHCWKMCNSDLGWQWCKNGLRHNNGISARMT